MTERKTEAELRAENKALLEMLALTNMKFRRAPRKPRKERADNLHPVIDFLLDEMTHAGMSATEVAMRAGLSCNVIGNWRKGDGASIATLEPALNVLGYTLAAVPLPETTQK